MGRDTDFEFGNNTAGDVDFSKYDTGERQEYGKFLDAATHIGKRAGARVKFTITGVRELDQKIFKFSDIAVDGYIKKNEPLTWTMKATSPNLRFIIKQLGPKTSKWRGKSVTLETVPWFNPRKRKTQNIINVVAK